MKYWLVSFPERLSSKVPNLVDMGLYSGVMWWLITFPEEAPSKVPNLL